MTTFFPAPGLAADIGGTNARFALIGEDGSQCCVEVLPCAEYDGLYAIVRAYLGAVRPAVTPRRAAIAIASPVTGDAVTMTNRDWCFSIEATRRELGLERLDVVNDFTAVALAVPHLESDDLLPIGGGDPPPDSPVAVLGPGTGLGMSALVPAPGGWVPLVTEGGHATMPAMNDREAAVLGLLRERFGHVSAERVLSGPGLTNLYRALSQLGGDGDTVPLEPAEITGKALNGSCSICGEALDMFSAMLGTVAGNLALTVGARGGVFIAGGIVPRLGADFAAAIFRRRFEAKGRFAGYLRDIPTTIVTRPFPAFVGLEKLATRE